MCKYRIIFINKHENGCEYTALIQSVTDKTDKKLLRLSPHADNKAKGFLINDNGEVTSSTQVFVLDKEREDSLDKWAEGETVIVTMTA